MSKIGVSLCVFLSATAVAVAEARTLTWNGGGSGNLSDPSWSEGVEEHLTPQDGDALVFPKGGSFINDIDGLKVSALTFTSSSLVILAGEKAITVMNGGKVLVSGSGLVTNSLPIQVGEPAVAVEGEEVAAPEAVIFAANGSGRKLVVSGVISGSAPIAVGAANGTVEFTGNNTFNGKLSVTNGKFNATGTNALGAGGDEIFFKTGTGDGRAKVTLVKVTVNKPVVINGSGTQTGEFSINGNYQSVFNGPVKVENLTLFLLSGWTTAIFKGGFNSTGTLAGQVETGSTFKLAGSDINIAAFNLGFTSSATTANKNNYAKYEVNAPIRLSGAGFKHYGMHIRLPRGQFLMNVANAITNTTSLAKDREVPLRYSGTAEDTKFNMNGYEQTFMSIQDEVKKSSNVITSDKSCTLRLKQNWVANTIIVNGQLQEPQFRKDTFYGTISGKVSVSVEGSDSCYFAGPNTSTGSFSLTNQAYCGFTSTGVWSGTNFFVSAGSTLVVSNTAALPAKSRIKLSDAPDQEVKSSILLGEGNYTATSMSVDGELLYRGTWGSSESNARFKDDVHFKGPGVLTLTTGAPFPGLRLIIK